MLAASQWIWQMDISTLCYAGCQALEVFPAAAEFALPGHHPRPLMSVAGQRGGHAWGSCAQRRGSQLHGAFYFCLKCSGFHFRLTPGPTAQGCLASHTIVRAVKAPVFFWCGLVGTAAAACAKQWAFPAAGVRLQQCWREFMGLPLKLTAQMKLSLFSLLHSCRILTDCTFSAADCQDEISQQEEHTFIIYVSDTGLPSKRWWEGLNPSSKMLRKAIRHC